MNNDADLEARISELIERKIAECLNPEHSDFWIPEKTHFLDHERYNRFFQFLDEATTTARKVLVSLVIGSLIAALIFGAAIKIKNMGP